MNKEINEILNNLKKSCYEIIFKEEYSYWNDTDSRILSTSNYLNDEEWIMDSEGRDLMFQIINFSELPLDNEIKKLQYFYNSDSSNIKIFDTVDEYVEAEKMDNINGVLFFKENYNLPDSETLKIMHNKEYEQLTTLFKKYDLYADPDDDFNEVYIKYMKKLLGHQGLKSFVGGNLNQFYWLHLDKKFYDKHEFIMQIETNFYTYIHIFRNKSDKNDFKSFMGRS